MTITLIQHCGKLQGASNEGISNWIGGWLDNAGFLDASSIHGFRFVVINKGNIVYIVNGLLKFAEEDSYQNGRVVGTAVSDCINITFTGKTLAALLEDLKIFTGCDDILLNSCDEQGRVDLQVYETADGGTASESGMQLWKDGKKKLYAVTYTALIYKAELSNLIEGF